MTDVGKVSNIGQPLLALLGGESRARASDPETSHLAARDAKDGDTRHKILSILRLPKYTQGLASYEVADILGTRRDMVSSNMAALVRVGLLINNGRVKSPATGHQSMRRKLVPEVFERHPISKLPPAAGFSSYEEIQLRKPIIYTVGFAFSSPGLNYVALVRKTRPEWQAGSLNGPGGKLDIDLDVTPLECQNREFAEECSLKVDAWKLFCVLSGLDFTGRPFEVHMYHAVIVSDSKQFVNYGLTDETVELYPVDKLMSDGSRFLTVANVPWLIHMAKAHIFNQQPVIHAREVTPVILKQSN